MARNYNRKVVPIHGNSSAIPSDLQIGELAVSVKPGDESLFTKNSDGDIAKIDLSHYTILTQSQYDALPTKDPNHIYYIK